MCENVLLLPVYMCKHCSRHINKLVPTQQWSPAAGFGDGFWVLWGKEAVTVK